MGSFYSFDNWYKNHEDPNDPTKAIPARRYVTCCGDDNDLERFSTVDLVTCINCFGFSTKGVFLMNTRSGAFFFFATIVTIAEFLVSSWSAWYWDDSKPITNADTIVSLASTFMFVVYAFSIEGAGIHRHNLEIIRWLSIVGGICDIALSVLSFLREDDGSFNTIISQLAFADIFVTPLRVLAAYLYYFSHSHATAMAVQI